MSREVIHIFKTGEYDPIRLREIIVESLKKEREEKESRKHEMKRKMLKQIKVDLKSIDDNIS